MAEKRDPTIELNERVDDTSGNVLPQGRPDLTPHSERTRIQDSLQKKQALAKEAQVAIHDGRTPIPQHNKADPSLPHAIGGTDPSLPQMMFEEEISDSQQAPQPMDDIETSYGGLRSRAKIMRVLSYVIVAGTGIYVGGKMCSGNRTVPNQPQMAMPTPVPPQPEPKPKQKHKLIKVQKDPSPTANAEEEQSFEPPDTEEPHKKEKNKLTRQYHNRIENEWYNPAFKALLELQEYESALSVTDEADRFYEEENMEALRLLRRALKLGEEENPLYGEWKNYVTKLIRMLKAESEAEESEE